MPEGNGLQKGVLMKDHKDLALAQTHMDEYLHDLQTIVNIDSGTYTKAGIDRVSAYLEQRFQTLGFTTRYDKQTQYGDHLIATHTGQSQNGPRILLIGHIDTVLADGEAARRPFTISRSNGMRIATGPGVLDMKSGVLIGMYALRLLIESQQASYSTATFVCNSDEEIGSPTSRPLIQELARQSDAVLIFEPGRAAETIVSSRKGCGQYRVEVHGISAHAGVEPDRGRNAILELSYQVQMMQALNGTIPGATLSVGIIRGGDRTNVVPDYAFFDMDVRVTDQASAEALEAAMHRVTKRNRLRDTRITLSGSILCQPFERNQRNARLIELARAAGSELGLKIQDAGSGGASDANNTSILGIPTIDGLGAGGGLAHNPGEFIELDYLPMRIALVAGLIRKIERKL
jgi:glutamate carboxypeptidase